LGQRPGTSCVISSFRASGSARNREHLINRMTVLAMHELGHTYALPHCEANPCIMRDAMGKMNLDDTDVFCKACEKWLLTTGVLHKE